MTIDWLAILIATVAAFLLGGLWYSPALFGKPWQRLAGLSDADVRTGTGKVFGLAFAMELAIAVGLDAYMPADASWLRGLHIGLMVSVFWVAPFVLINALFERRAMALALINMGYAIASLSLMAVLIAVV
jgi:hypothetical protein